MDFQFVMIYNINTNTGHLENIDLLSYMGWENLNTITVHVYMHLVGTLEST